MLFASGEFKVKAKAARMYSFETYGGAGLYLRPLLTLALDDVTLALDDVRDRLRAPTALSPAKEPLPRTHLTLETPN